MWEPSAEQRARDGRLAWTIVLTCAVFTLALTAVLLTMLFRSAERSIAEERDRFAQAVNPIRPSLAPPPDTAQPAEDWRTWLSPRNGPAAALARGEHGTVRVTLAIDAAGNPTGCSVAQSSGFYGLDNGTCLALMRAGRFAPAKAGEPGAGVGEVRRWTSPDVTWNAKP